MGSFASVPLQLSMTPSTAQVKKISSMSGMNDLERLDQKRTKLASSGSKRREKTEALR